MTKIEDEEWVNSLALLLSENLSGLDTVDALNSLGKSILMIILDHLNKLSNEDDFNEAIKEYMSFFDFYKEKLLHIKFKKD